ncbi:enoyl ACP reductase FabMG family protein [Janthinobacterium sp. GB1R12]|uniref:enoyl ACP reductase FabMG family protein n=1 Tax=Janthinobacterium sp. GB1R12 TaxID=3424190 RepID=UPI003F1F84B5
MTEITSLRDIPQKNIFRKGDTFVLFGELFGRGYVNGLLDEARKAGMNIVGMTVGRRDENMALRPLNAEELAEAEANLGGRIINVPLMAGFDLDAPAGEPTPTALLADMTLKSWQEDKLDWAQIERCREAGIARFSASVAKAMAELDSLIPDGSNVYFAHTMAGGIPKVKVFLAIANRIYKGRGERFMSSRALLDSDLGKLILMNFDEVTANTLQHLIDGSAAIRARIEQTGGQVRYSAYGYHGTEILIDGKYQWQTYSNYTQGLAKMRLENVAKAAWEKGIKATVFNCPEIRTNSSDIFVGVELSLFPLLDALKKEGGAAWAEEQWKICQGLLEDGVSLQDLLDRIAAYNGDATSVQFRNFAAWPMDNTPELAEVMIGTSDDITKLHKDRKELITDHLSSLVLEGTGPLMFHEMSEPKAPVIWLNHDIIARQLNSVHN